MTLAQKDLRAEFRSKEAINAALSFALVILVIFSFAFEPTAQETRAIAGGLLWIAFAFAGVLILNRSFARELPNDCLDGLLVSPVSPASIFLGKALASFVLITAMELICLPVFGIFYNVRWAVQVAPLLLVLALGTWGLVVIGTSFGALTVNVRLRELMLPLLIYPVMMPALLASIRLSTALLAGETLSGDNANWLRLLIAFDAVFTALSLTLIDFVLVSS